MNIIIERESLLRALQTVSGAVEKRQTLPILSHVLLEVKDQQLTVSATDLEIELSARAAVQHVEQVGAITTSGRKLIDICRSLPADAVLNFQLAQQKLSIQAGKSRFTLTTLPAADFPSIEESPGQAEWTLPQKTLHHLLQATHFSMAQQDVRYYLNGMLLQFDQNTVRTVTTDGHRLALSIEDSQQQAMSHQVIIPRKAVVELLRLLNEDEQTLTVTIAANHIRVNTADFTFTSKLIDGAFPDYQRVIPSGSDKLITLDRDLIKDALTRVSILSNEKFKAVRILLQENLLRIITHNSQQEQAEEEIGINFHGEALEIGVNALYLIDILNHVPEGKVQFSFKDSDHSILIESLVEPNLCYVVMPMRL